MTLTNHLVFTPPKDGGLPQYARGMLTNWMFEQVKMQMREGMYLVGLAETITPKADGVLSRVEWVLTFKSERVA